MFAFWLPIGLDKNRIDVDLSAKRQVKKCFMKCLNLLPSLSIPLFLNVQPTTTIRVNYPFPIDSMADHFSSTVKAIIKGSEAQLHLSRKKTGCA
jgi:hypothetical protein